MMVDKKVMEEAKKEEVEGPGEVDLSIPSAQQRQILAIAEAVADALNGRLDGLVEAICGRLGELVEVVESLNLAELEDEESEFVDSSVVIPLSNNDQQVALDWLNTRYEQVDLTEVRQGFDRGNGVYRPDVDLLHLEASTSDKKFVNWPTLAEDDFDPGISVPDGVKYNELDTRKMAELVESIFAEEDYRKNAWIFSKKETDQWIEQLMILLGVNAHSKALPFFWRMFSEGLTPEQLLSVYREEMADREAHQREREAEALQTGMMPVEDGGRLADWSIYHLCQELGIDFPDEETRRRVVAKAEQSIRPAKAS